MEPMLLAAPDLAILLAIVLLLFGGSRLAGVGKSTGRALREFKEETRGLSDQNTADQSVAQQPLANPPSATPPPVGSGPEKGPARLT